MIKKDLRLWQEQVRLSSVRLAEEIGVTKQTIHNLRSGKTKPSQKTLVALNDVVAKYDDKPFPAELFFVTQNV